VIIISFRIFKKTLAENQEFEKNISNLLDISEIACSSSRENRKQLERIIGKFDFSVIPGDRKTDGFTRTLKFGNYTLTEKNITHFYAKYNVNENLLLEYNCGNFKVVNKNDEIDETLANTYQLDIKSFYEKAYKMVFAPALEKETADIAKLILDNVEELGYPYTFTRFYKGLHNDDNIRLLRMGTLDWWACSILEKNGQIQFFADNFLGVCEPYDRQTAERLYESELKNDFKLLTIESKKAQIKVENHI